MTAAALTGLFAAPDARAGTALVRGWNNVPYLGVSGSPEAALSSLNGQYAAVYRWDAAGQKYDLYAPTLPAYVNTLTQLNNGDAVWINLTGDSGSLPSVAGTGAPGPGHVSVAASTFVPMNDLAIYEKSFNQLNPVGADEASKRYFAAVHLPDGAIITSMTAAFEATGGEVQVRLDFTPLSNGNGASQIFKLVEVLSSAGASPQTATAFSHTVDNNANVYFLVVDLTGGAGTKLRGVSIAYTG
jgi:hypothetical protein